MMSKKVYEGVLKKIKEMVESENIDFAEICNLIKLLKVD